MPVQRHNDPDQGKINRKAARETRLVKGQNACQEDGLGVDGCVGICLVETESCRQEYVDAHVKVAV